MAESAATVAIGDILDRHADERGALLEVLHDVQARYGHIPEAALRPISRRMKIPEAHIYGTATFYSHFYLEPRGERHVRICKGPSCRMAGAQGVIDAARRSLGTEPGETTTDGRYTLETVSCIGLCDCAPALRIGETPFGSVEASGVEALLRSPDDAEPLAIPIYEGSVLLRGSRAPLTALADYEAEAGMAALKKVANGEMSTDAVIDTITESGLRGCGGAGFPAGMKWDFVRKETAAPKYVVCNADEGEPGTFKDREILLTNPFAVIEGMIVAGLATGCQRGYIYIRHEYPEAQEIIAGAIEQCGQAGLLGPNAAGSGKPFTLAMRRGAGAYICGEEMALINSLQGERGMSEIKPPFPTQQGLFGKPTLVNNVETLALVPAILTRGADWFAAQGVGDENGVKLYSLSGRVVRPGNYELPFGTTARELIFDHGGGIPGGRRLKAFLPGGASASVLTEEHLDVPLSFDALAKAGSMLGSAAIIVMDEQTCMVDLARQTSLFFSEESCGKCAPCQIGTRRMYEILDRIVAGEGKLADLELIEELAEMIIPASICGLGQAAPNPVTSALKHFRAEFETHITRGECIAGSCTRGWE